MGIKTLNLDGLGLQLLQDEHEMKVSIDTFMLCSFTNLKKIQNQILDLGTNNGAIAMILAKFYPNKKIHGIDINQNAINLANQNKVNNQVNNVTLEVIDFFDLNEQTKYDVIISNPPYYQKPKTRLSKQVGMVDAKYDDYLPIEKFFQKATKLLKPKGEIYIIYLTEALFQISHYAMKADLNIKEIQMVHTTKAKNSKLVLIKMKKNSMPGLIVHPPLTLSDDEREISDYINMVLRSKQNV